MTTHIAQKATAKLRFFCISQISNSLLFLLLFFFSNGCVVFDTLFFGCCVIVNCVFFFLISRCLHDVMFAHLFCCFLNGSFCRL